MASTNYDSIPADADRSNADESSSLFEPSLKRTPARQNKGLIVAAGLLFVVAIAAFNGNWDESSLSQVLSPLWGRSHKGRRERAKERDDVDDDRVADDDSHKSSSHHGGVRECTFLECWKGSCSWKDAPYLCLKQNNPTSNMGCAAHPWRKGTCDDECDLSGCPDMAAPKSVESCKHQQCPEEWCCGQQHCGSDMPYQCLGGIAKGGCHSDPFKWNVKVNDETCSKCCDVKTCPDVSKCDKIMTKHATIADDDYSSASKHTCVLSFLLAFATMSSMFLGLW